MLDEAIKWGDYTVEAGSSVQFKNKIKIAELAYEYAFLHAPTFDFLTKLDVARGSFDGRLRPSGSGLPLFVTGAC